jgi:hypothetical protein
MCGSTVSSQQQEMKPNTVSQHAANIHLPYLVCGRGILVCVGQWLQPMFSYWMTVYHVQFGWRLSLSGSCGWLSAGGPGTPVLVIGAFTLWIGPLPSSSSSRQWQSLDVPVAHYQFVCLPSFIWPLPGAVGMVHQWTQGISPTGHCPILWSCWGESVIPNLAVPLQHLLAHINNQCPPQW